MSDAQLAETARRTPLGRVGMPQYCANLDRFLCSEQGAWINGQLLSSKGGVA
jgi:3-oxoacyl-[acyl-carrier protein] reductase